MSTQVQLRRGTAAQHATFVGAPGEITYVTDENTIRVHDGVTPGGHEVSDADLRQAFDAHLADDVPHPNIKTINIKDYLSLDGYVDKGYSPLLLHYGGVGTTTPKYEEYLFSSYEHGGDLLPDTKLVAKFTLTPSVAYSFKVSFTGSRSSSVPTVQSYAEKTIFFHQHDNNITMVEEFDGLLRNFVSDDISIESVGSGNNFNLVIKSPANLGLTWLLNVKIATGRGTIDFNNIEVVSI